MAYRKPFTLEQWREAAREYESFRSNVHELRKAYPPLNGREKRVLVRYRDSVRAIGEAVKRGMKLDVDELNAQVSLARNAMAEYFRVKQLGQ
jgi:hypothetical protein